MSKRNLIEQVASALGTNPGLVEKDWHVVRALGVLASLGETPATAVFSGGTSLLKGWGLIKRFSEDIDFKVVMPAAKSGVQERKQRRSYRERVLAALTAGEFELVGAPLVGNESRYFSADVAYETLFPMVQGLRPHIRIEMSFRAPALKAIERPIRSLIGEAQKHAPEVEGFPCVDPIETAADKLSALAWRVCTRKRGSEDDDPAMIRHLYDLAALEGHLTKAKEFAVLVRQIAAEDTGRGGEGAPSDPAARFAAMLKLLERDKLWASEYEAFVWQVSFAKPAERITFTEALAAASKLVKSVYGEGRK